MGPGETEPEWPGWGRTPNRPRTLARIVMGRTAHRTKTLEVTEVTGKAVGTRKFGEFAGLAQIGSSRVVLTWEDEFTPFRI